MSFLVPSSPPSSGPRTERKQKEWIRYINGCQEIMTEKTDVQSKIRMQM